MTFKEQGTDECPECGSMMVLRSNRKTEEQFWGCSRYPECTGTRKFNGNQDSLEKQSPSDRYRNNDRRRWEHE